MLFDILLETQSLSDFIDTMLENIQDEQIEKWYLAGGGGDKTFEEYKSELIVRQSRNDRLFNTADILRDSLNILGMGIEDGSI